MIYTRIGENRDEIKKLKALAFLNSEERIFKVLKRQHFPIKYENYKRGLHLKGLCHQFRIASK